MPAQTLSDEVSQLHHLFALAATRHPHAVAIDVPPGIGRPARVRVTYAELDRWSCGLARAMPVWTDPDPSVAILLPRDSPSLYAAQLGVLRSGAAFACLDPAFPPPHLAEVLAHSLALITDAAGLARLADLGIEPPPVVDPGRRETPHRPESAPRPMSGREAGGGDCLAYLIYTSGTTGTPKGVMIEHRGIVNLATANRGYFGLGVGDRVAQCSSPAYDSSVEETWLAFAAGATLVPMDDETVRLGPDLVPWLRRERVTAFCPPPTLLRAMACADPARELPGLRLLYVGGEPLTADLAAAWAPGRHLENGYGPTECTVTVVRGRVEADGPVTIGVPVAGHLAWILNDLLEPVADGEPGELCIAGPGLARGYRGDPAATAAKFPMHPQFGRICRTGDAARRRADGRIEHLGRLDGQVKLRGYRVELGAVELALEGCPGVAAAGCRVQGTPGNELLAAHVVARHPAAPPCVRGLREALRRRLPEYMVPARVGFLERLPTQVGGKLDRPALPDLPAGSGSGGRDVRPRDGREAEVAAVFARVLGLASVSVDDDFFGDLGGNSLTATAVISALRRGGRPAVAVRDIYEARTAAALALRLRDAPPPIPTRANPRPRVRPGRRFFVGLAQALWLLLHLAAASALGYALAFLALPAAVERIGVAWSVLLAPAVWVLVGLLALPATVAWTAALRHLLIGRYRSGRYPVDGWFYARHWAVAHAAGRVPWGLIEGTVFQSSVLRALGARVGRGVHFHSGVDLMRGGWDLIDIGDGATLCEDADVRAVDLDAGDLVVGPVRIGAGATLDVRAGVCGHTEIGPDGYLAALSWLPPGGSVPPGERWDGIPAVAAGSSPPRPETMPGGSLPPAVHGAVLVVGRCARKVLGVLPGFALAALVAARVPDLDGRAAEWLARPELPAAVGAALLALVCASVPLGLIAQALGLRLLGRVRPGAHGQWGWEAVRIGIKTGAVQGAGRWLSGSLFWPCWLRLAGMRVGPGCEISTIIDTVPETVSVGRECFFADGVYFCGPRRHRGTITVSPTAVAAHTFLGNHAVVPAGGSYPEGLFVGVSTVAPDSAGARTGWFGHPALELPRREVAEADRRLTHEPGPVRFANRVFWEGLRFTLPALPLAVGYGWYACVAGAEPASLPTLLPSAALAAASIPCAAAIGLKWALLGRVRPGVHPLWSCWCSRWDFHYVAWNHWASGPLAALEGTPMLHFVLRWAGVRLGRGVVLGPGSSHVVDPDMIEIGDGATVTGHFQAHSFEDRVLKIDRLRVGAGATLGGNAVAFYGADIGEGAWVGPHAVVMKGEDLPAGGRFTGCPCTVQEVG